VRDACSPSFHRPGNARRRCWSINCEWWWNSSTVSYDVQSLDSATTNWLTEMLNRQEDKYYSVHINYTSAHINTSALFSMQIKYWILTCKVLDPMPAVSAYSAILLPSSAVIWRSVANHQAPLYVSMCRCAPMRVLCWPNIFYFFCCCHSNLWLLRHLCRHIPGSISRADDTVMSLNNNNSHGTVLASVPAS